MDQLVQFTVGELLTFLAGVIGIAGLVLSWVVSQVRNATNTVLQVSQQMRQALAAHETAAAERYVTRHELAAVERRLAEAVDRIYDELGIIRQHQCGPVKPGGLQPYSKRRPSGAVSDSEGETR